MKVSNACILIAVLGWSGAGLADDTVKSGGNLDKPGRAVDEDTVKSGGRPDKPGRALDGNATSSGSPTNKQDNEVETVNTNTR